MWMLNRQWWMVNSEIFGPFPYPLSSNLRPQIFKPQTSNFKPQTPNLKPQTPNLKPQTSNLKPQTSNLKPQTSNLKPQTSNPKPQTSNFKPQTSNPKPQTSNPKPQTSNPKTAGWKGGLVRVCFGSASGLVRVCFGSYRRRSGEIPNNYRTLFAKTHIYSEAGMLQTWLWPGTDREAAGGK